MAKPVRFTPKKTDHGWRLNIPKKFSETGKRQQLFYRTQGLALAAADEMKKKRETFGDQARAISATLAEQAHAAAALLAPYGVDLLEAARIVADLRQRETASRPLSEAVKAWLAACDGLRPRTVRNYKLTAGRLVETLGSRLLATVTAEEIQATIAPAGTTASSAAERIRNAKAFWNYSAGKGWCKAETFGGVEMPKTSREGKEIEILSPEEAAALLAVAEEHFPQAVATFALQLFAGIRAEEVIRLDAEHVSAEGIDLPASVTKKGRRRHITPSKTLEAWLTEYPFQPCSNWRETSAACRRLAGWDVSARIITERIEAGTMKPIPEPTRGRWSQNVLRHSHASYAVASGATVDNLLFEFGHVGNAQVLREHYVGRASKKEAVAFYAIGPKGKKLPSLKIA
ncbi:MAG: hypothetical protein EOP88_10665 [Verrucomicrobiaceae bacterium]|nr:MAG: hypothetical protein EOP88_10665 [Verrucomicrobiaceae bacterium]